MQLQLQQQRPSHLPPPTPLIIGPEHFNELHLASVTFSGVVAKYLQEMALA